MTASRQDSGELYHSFTPLLLRALGRLARQGFVVLPQDYPDLFQEFYLAAWESLRRNHDPRRPFPPYLFRAFLNFARSWVLRESRYRKVLERAALAMNGVEPNSREHAAVTSAEQRLDVTHSLSRLSRSERDYLLSYVKEQSVRRVAEVMHVSRHEARQRVVDAIGRFIVGLGRPPGITEDGWDVARLVWGDQRSIEDCAMILSKDIADIEQMHQRNAAIVGRILSRLGPADGGHRILPE